MKLKTQKIRSYVSLPYLTIKIKFLERALLNIPRFRLLSKAKGSSEVIAVKCLLLRLRLRLRVILRVLFRFEQAHADAVRVFLS